MGELVRGPLLRTPQGYVVVATLVLYVALAVASGVLGMNPLGRSQTTSLVLCAAWPIVVFLAFTRLGLPEFTPSGWQALWLTVIALMPLTWRFF